MYGIFGNKKHFKGMTLHEIMVTLFILNLTIFAVIGVMCVLLKSSRQSSDKSAGILVANSILGEYLQANKTELYNIENGRKKYGLRTYDYSITVTNIEVQDNEGLFKVQIDVTWSETDEDYGGAKQMLKTTISTITRGALRNAAHSETQTGNPM